jgi:hypothetical protein
MASLERSIDINIYIERMVDRVGEFEYDPTLSRPEFYAHIVNLAEDVPSECELRIARSWWDSENSTYEPLVRIIPRQLNDQGEINIPLWALHKAIDQIQRRTLENERAQANRVGVSIDIEGKAVVEFTDWLPCRQDTHIRLPGQQEGFWLTNGVVGAKLLEDEVLFDININDVGIREDIEISIAGQKQRVKHSLYFFQLVIGRVLPADEWEEDKPKNPEHTFRPRPQIPIANGPLPSGGRPGMGGPMRG